jgi:hypothetical protein
MAKDAKLSGRGDWPPWAKYILNGVYSDQIYSELNANSQRVAPPSCIAISWSVATNSPNRALLLGSKDESMRVCEIRAVGVSGIDRQ